MRQIESLARGVQRLTMDRHHLAQAFREACQEQPNAISASDFKPPVYRSSTSDVAKYSDQAVTLFHQHLDLWVCRDQGSDRLGRPFYVQLIPKGNDEESIRQAAKSFWTHPSASIRDEFGAFAQRQSQWLPHPHGVYIAGEMAHPWGKMFRDVMANQASSPSMREAVFVAMYGNIQDPMCQHCIHHFTHEGSRSGEHQLQPFHACIAHPELAGGRCANCLFNDDSGCVYAILNKLMAGGWTDLKASINPRTMIRIHTEPLAMLLPNGHGQQGVDETEDVDMDVEPDKVRR